MTRIFILLCTLFTFQLSAQHAGNTIYEMAGNAAIYGTENPTKPRSLYTQSGNTINAQVSILYHAKVLGYQAVFGLAEEAESVEKCNNKIHDRLEGFVDGLKKMGIKSENIFVDAITQTRVYDYEVVQNTAKERLSGFEIKKNVLIGFEDDSQLDEMMNVAAKYGIYDLIKIEYLTENQEDIALIVLEEALVSIPKKQELIRLMLSKEHVNKARIMGINVQTVEPDQSYKSYQAAQANHVSNDSRYHKLTKISARKVTTHYYDALPEINYDKVLYGNVNKLIPTVQFAFTYIIQFEAI